MIAYLTLFLTTCISFQDGKAPYIGIDATTVPGNQGVRIVKVDQGSPAESAGLKPNDIITSVSSKPIADFEALARILEKSKINDRLSVTYTRDLHIYSTMLVVGTKSTKIPSDNKPPLPISELDLNNVENLDSKDELRNPSELKQFDMNSEIALQETTPNTFDVSGFFAKPEIGIEIRPVPTSPVTIQFDDGRQAQVNQAWKVTQILPLSAASTSGLNFGDLIFTFNGEVCTDQNQLSQLLSNSKSLKKMDISVMSPGTVISKKITFWLDNSLYLTEENERLMEENRQLKNRIQELEEQVKSLQNKHS